MRSAELRWSCLGKCQARQIPLLLVSLHPGCSSRRYSQPVELARERERAAEREEKEREHMISEKERVKRGAEVWRQRDNVDKVSHTPWIPPAAPSAATTPPSNSCSAVSLLPWEKSLDFHDWVTCKVTDPPERIFICRIKPSFQFHLCSKWWRQWVHFCHKKYRWEVFCVGKIS